LSITERQDQPHHFERLVSYTYRYGIAGRWRGLRMFGTLGLAALVPVAVFAWPAAAEDLAAIAACWLVLGRATLRWCEQNSYHRAALVQEYYDTELFGLDWNNALVGEQPNVADLVADAQKLTRPKRLTKLKKWYDVDLSGLPWPVDVMTCQLQSSIWSRRDQKAYSIFLGVAAGIWVAAGVIYGAAVGMSLSHFLVALFLPSAPALVDAVELSSAHWRYSGERLAVETDAQNAMRAFRFTQQLPSPAVARALQDAAYRLRRDQPRVPRWFYELRRHGSTLVSRRAADNLHADPSD
jgi:hypothetical protein